MSSLRASVITNKSPKRPSPDRSPNPDAFRKIALSSTDSPLIHKHNNTLKKDKSQIDKDLIKQNKALRQQIKKLHIQVPDKASTALQSTYKNIMDGKQKRSRFDEITQDNKEIVFQQFNRLMKQSKHLTNKRVRQLQQRLKMVQSLHQRMCEYIAENKYPGLKSTSKKSRVSNSPHRAGHITKRTEEQNSFLTPLRQQNYYKDKYLNLEPQLFLIKQQNIELVRKLKQTQFDLNENLRIKDQYKNEINQRNETILELKQKISEIEKELESQLSLPRFDIIKVPVVDLEEEIQHLKEELQYEKQSKNKSEKAMQLIENNYELSQKSLEIIKKQNQKLKQNNSRLQKQLKQINTLKQKLTEENIKIANNLGELNKQYENQKQKCMQMQKQKSNKIQGVQYLKVRSKSPPSHIEAYQSQKQQIFLLQSKISELQYQNHQLNLFQRKYYTQNIALVDQMKSLNRAVNRYMGTSQKRNSINGLGKIMKQSQRDPQFQMIQSTLETILLRLGAIHKQIKVADSFRKKVNDI